MKMTGMYYISLLPAADDEAFVKQMTQVVFNDVAALKATRITSGITHQLLKGSSEFREYVWQVTIHLVTDKGYDFGENVERVQQSVADWGLVTGMDVYTVIET
jgi:hypothetical protein